MTELLAYALLCVFGVAAAALTAYMWLKTLEAQYP
jgi:hypothetical protein